MSQQDKWYQRTPKAGDVRAVLPSLSGVFTAEDVSVALGAPSRCNSRIGRILLHELAPLGVVRPVRAPRPNKATRYTCAEAAHSTEGKGER